MTSSVSVGAAGAQSSRLLGERGRQQHNEHCLGILAFDVHCTLDLNFKEEVASRLDNTQCLAQRCAVIVTVVNGVLKHITVADFFFKLFFLWCFFFYC